MNAVAKIADPVEISVALVEESHALVILQDAEKADAFYEKCKAWGDEVARKEELKAAEAKRIADEQAKREQNKAHQGRVMAAAKTALMGLGVGEATAKTIVLAIKAGEVPNVSISF